MVVKIHGPNSPYREAFTLTPQTSNGARFLVETLLELEPDNPINSTRQAVLDNLPHIELVPYDGADYVDQQAALLAHEVTEAA